MAAKKPGAGKIPAPAPAPGSRDGPPAPAPVQVATSGAYQPLATLANSTDSTLTIVVDLTSLTEAKKQALEEFLRDDGVARMRAFGQGSGGP